MKAQAALVGANGHAVLDAVAPVDLHGAVIVCPAHAEHDGALSLHQTLEQAVVCVTWVLFNKGPQAFHHLGDGLQVFRLARIAKSHMGQEAFGGRVFHRSNGFLHQKNRIWSAGLARCNMGLCSKVIRLCTYLCPITGIF
ncbi:hypothetical protein D3C71_1773080 [compost metagenome]